MSDGDALIRAILMHPDDHTPRLVYADWLEEHGEPERAEFIRVQVELAILLDTQYLREAPCPENARIAELNRSVREALRRNLSWWDGLAELIGSPGTLLFASDGMLGYGTEYRWRCSRGFVSEIRLPLAAFIQHAEALFCAHPVTRVTLTDREPWVNATNPPTHAGWWCENELMDCATESEVLPLPLMICMDDDKRRRDRLIAARFTADRMHGVILFEDRTTALAALSDACVAYGRESAGLPPLTPASESPA